MNVCETWGKSTHGGHIPYYTYLKIIHQANKLSNKICPSLLSCQSYLHNNLGGQLQVWNFCIGASLLILSWKVVAQRVPQLKVHSVASRSSQPQSIPHDKGPLPHMSSVQTASP